MAYFSDQVISANKLIIAAAVIYAGLVSFAHAADRSGQWMDTRNHLALGNLPDSSEPVARLDYAKAACRAKTGQIAGAEPAAPGWPECLRAQGFVWLDDSPAQIAAREKARQDQQNRETLHAFGQALTGVAEAMQPHGCNGQIQPSGSFHTNCY